MTMSMSMGKQANQNNKAHVSGNWVWIEHYLSQLLAQIQRYTHMMYLVGW